MSLELDPSVAEWLPECRRCGEQLTSWDEAVGVPIARRADDEPFAIGVFHRLCPEERGAYVSESPVVYDRMYDALDALNREERAQS